MLKYEFFAKPKHAPLKQWFRTVSEMLYKIQELENLTKTIEALVQPRTDGCSRPADRAAHQSVKGCEIAMHFAILLPDDQ